MGIREADLRKSDLEDPNLTRLNEVIREMQREINRLGGQTGTIAIDANIDMQGHKILNQGT